MGLTMARSKARQLHTPRAALDAYTHIPGECSRVVQRFCRPSRQSTGASPSPEGCEALSTPRTIRRRLGPRGWPGRLHLARSSRQAGSAIGPSWRVPRSATPGMPSVLPQRQYPRLLSARPIPLRGCRLSWDSQPRVVSLLRLVGTRC